MTTAPMPLAEITQSAIRLLCQEIGVVNTARFLNQFSTGDGDYAEERDALFGSLSVEEIASKIKSLR